MALAKRARAITAEIFFGVFPHMTVLPRDPHNPSRFDMIDLGRIMQFHD